MSWWIFGATIVLSLFDIVYGQRGILLANEGDGTDGHRIESTSFTSTDTTFSAMFWYKPGDTEECTLLTMDSNPFSVGVYKSPIVAFYIPKQNTGYLTLLSNTALAVGQCMHIAVTFSAITGVGRMYINGALEREEHLSGMFGNVTISGKFELGGAPGNRFANGVFDHVIVVMREVDANFIDNAMRGEYPNPGSFLAFTWSFENDTRSQILSYPSGLSGTVLRYQGGNQETAEGQFVTGCPSASTTRPTTFNTFVSTTVSPTTTTTTTRTTVSSFLPTTTSSSSTTTIIRTSTASTSSSNDITTGRRVSTSQSDTSTTGMTSSTPTSTSIITGAQTSSTSTAVFTTTPTSTTAHTLSTTTALTSTTALPPASSSSSTTALSSTASQTPVDDTTDGYSTTITDEESDLLTIVLSAVGGGVGLLCIFIIIVVLLLRSKKNKKDEEQIDEEALQERQPTNPPVLESEAPKSGRPTNTLQQVRKLTGIAVKNRLGGGNFGDVYYGEWDGTPVALKQLKNDEDYDSFVSEAATLSQLIHPNIVQFLGVYESGDGKKYIVTEYLKKGSLRDTLIKEQDELSSLDLLNFAILICKGMVYLEKNHIIHRDLAARNILLDDNTHLKIADFGMSKFGSEYTAKAAKIPIRWCAPELLLKGIFSHKSDVWAFGVLIWELFQHGNVPYGELSNEEVFNEVPKGKRLKQPGYFVHTIVSLIRVNRKPEERPTFVELLEKLQNGDSSHVLKSQPDTHTTTTDPSRVHYYYQNTPDGGGATEH